LEFGHFHDFECLLGLMGGHLPQPFHGQDALLFKRFGEFQTRSRGADIERFERLGQSYHLGVLRCSR
jgi:hypothetical protein